MAFARCSCWPAAFAALVVPLWMAVWSGHLSTWTGPFTPTDWHIHELLFGYTSAVIAGFLFHRDPELDRTDADTGLAADGAGRAVDGRADCGRRGPWPGPVAVMALDCAFLLAIGAMMTVEIVAGRNWSNLRVVVPVLLYLAANVTFHLEAMQFGTADVWPPAGVRDGGSADRADRRADHPELHKRNWLAKQGPGPMPVPFGRFDAASLVLTLAALIVLGRAMPEARLTGVALILAGTVQALRLARWRGWRVWRSACC
jgi:uncharacterized protein involved in response to NO